MKRQYGRNICFRLEMLQWKGRLYLLYVSSISAKYKHQYIRQFFMPIFESIVNISSSIPTSSSTFNIKIAKKLALNLPWNVNTHKIAKYWQWIVYIEEILAFSFEMFQWNGEIFLPNIASILPHHKYSYI